MLLPASAPSQRLCSAEERQTLGRHEVAHHRNDALRFSDNPFELSLKLRVGPIGTDQLLQVRPIPRPASIVAAGQSRQPGRQIMTSIPESPSPMGSPSATDSPIMHKRKEISSSPEEGSSKRAKVDERRDSDHDKDSSRRHNYSTVEFRATNPASYDDHDPYRRKGVTQEEKKRGMRLFGGVLSTLSQSNPTTQQRKRQEVEKRQQERVRQRQLEVEKKRSDKLARLTDVRKEVQIMFDERVVPLPMLLGISSPLTGRTDAIETREYAFQGTLTLDQGRAQDRESNSALVDVPMR